MDIARLAKEVAISTEQRERPYERLLGDEALTVLMEWRQCTRPAPL